MAKQYLDLQGLQTFKTGMQNWVGDQIEALDTSSDVTLASKNSSTDIITLTGSMKEVDGVISKGTGTDIALAKVAATGVSSDVQYQAASGNDPAVSVEDALDDIYEQIGAGGSVSEQIASAIEALDGSATIASVSNGVVTLKAGITEADGVVDNSTGSDITLAKLATTGSAADTSYDNTSSELLATTVQGAIDEIDDVLDTLGSAATAEVATSAITELSTDDSLVSAAQVATFVAAEIAGLEGAMHFVGVIERQTGETDAQAIARVVTSPEAGDVVVISDNALEYIYVNSTVGWREVGDETSFVKKTTTIAGVDLQDNITKSEMLTALNVADGAQVNVVETVKVNGSALTPDANKAVNVTVAEGSTNGTVAVNGSDVAVHGLGSAAYTDSSAYEAAGAVSTAIAALDADVDASGTAQHSGTFVVSGITEVDGVITAVDSVEVEAAGAAASALSTAEAYTDTAIGGLDAVADGTKTAIDGSTSRTKTNSDAVFALQGVTEVDGKLSVMTVVEVAEIGTGTGRTGTGTTQDPYVYADNIKGVKTLIADTDANIGSIPDASINALFS